MQFSFQRLSQVPGGTFIGNIAQVSELYTNQNMSRTYHCKSESTFNGTNSSVQVQTIQGWEFQKIMIRITIRIEKL